MIELGAVTRALLAIARDLRDDRVLAEQICLACVAGLDVDGAAISVLTASTMRETLWASDPTAELLEDLQFSLGEGACIEAAVTARPVLVPDLSDTAETSRWPIYAAAVVEQAGVGAVFALPLLWGAITVGVLDLYRRAPGSLSQEQSRDALSAADAAALMLLGLRTDPGEDLAWDRSWRFIRPPVWSWPSSRSARPTPSPGYAPMRSPSSGSSATSPATWWPDGCTSARTRDCHDELAGGIGNDHHGKRP